MLFERVRQVGAALDQVRRLRHIAAVLLNDSRRAWATSTDLQIANALCTDEWVGRKVNLNPAGELLV